MDYRAEFDPALESSLNIDERKNPVSSSLTSGGFNITCTRQGEIGLLKRFPTGLESRIAINSSARPTIPEWMVSAPVPQSTGFESASTPAA